MAIGTATAIGLGISAIGSATQIIQGANAKAEADQAAKNAANDLARIQEADRFKALQVPTLGLGLAQQNIQARQAQELQGLQDIGAAGVLGGLTKLETQGRAQDLELAAQADQMQYQRDAMLAQNAQQLEQNRAQREGALASSRLQGAQMSSAQNAANVQAGIAGLGQLGGQFALAAYKNQPLYDSATQTGYNANGTVTPDQAAANAQKAFAPQIASMKPNVPSPGSVAPQLQANKMAGLRAAQGQYDTMQADRLDGLRRIQGMYDSEYKWDPINNQWIQNAPY
jgi:hypothetical protein